MYSFETNIRVRYAETDQMKYVYYGAYCQYYEIGRVELIRSLGVSYRSLEIQGFLMPVKSLRIEYKKPAFYDDLLTIETSINKIPKTSLVFYTKIYNQANDLINVGQAELVFVDKSKNKVCLAPQNLIEKIQTKIISSP